MRRMTEGALLCLLLLSGAASAGLLEPRDPLRRWLDTEVIPELGERLSRHPDFRQAIVDFMPVAGGAARTDATRLHAALEQHLRQRLLGFDGVALHLDAGQMPCAPPRDIDYAIGIEIAQGSGREARVTVALLDLQRRIWVSGASQTWHGRLAEAQIRAYEEILRPQSPGSASAPFGFEETSAVTASLLEQLRCVLPRGVDGAVYFEYPEDPRAIRVALELRRQLMLTPLFVLSDRDTDAEWLLRMQIDPTAIGAGEIGVELIDRDSSARQRVASVFVERHDGRSGYQAIQAAVPVPDAVQAASPLVGLPAVTLVERTGICGRGLDNVCTEVRFDLVEPAHLLVFSTRNEVASLAQCDAAELFRSPGEHRFRLQIDRNGSRRRPAMGVYVLAIRRSEAARELHHIVASAPGACGTSPDTDRGAWIARLETAMRRHEGVVQWRAIHLDEEARPL